MKASVLRRVTLLVVSLMVSGCAVIRPQADAMDYSAVASPSTMSNRAMTPLDSDLPFARNFDMALRHAQDLRKRGKRDEASRVLAQLVLASPDDPRVVGEYGKIMLETGRTDDAVAFLERGVSLQPSDWTLLSALGVAYDQSGKRDAARASFHRALALKPGETTILSNLALSHMQAGELDEAERLLLQASEQRKDTVGIAEKLAMVRNIRATTAQSRPLTVSPLSQATVPARDSGTVSQTQPVEPPAPIPPAIETPPAPTPAPESIEDEEIDEPQDVATLSSPVVAGATTNTTEINDISQNSNVMPEKMARVATSPARRSSLAAPRSLPPSRLISLNTSRLSSNIEVKTEQAATTVTAPPKAVTAETTQSARATSAPKTTAPRLSVSMRAERVPAPAPPKAETAVTSTPAAPPGTTVATAAAPLRAANPTPQAVFMTRRADVARAAASRTAPTPLVLAPPRDSWESMVRVSLPPATDAGINPIARADQGNAPPPSARPATWSDIVTGWVTAALGFISAFWA